MIILNESMNFKDPKESDDPNYSMIPAADGLVEFIMMKEIEY